ncbi:hypothetical protein NE865_08544 [Phthorimaea operculella]|nr:hypothetical protein NE865_08544 [Phthorimaea operculella]
MQCCKCENALRDPEAIKCTACQLQYHFQCASLSEEEFKRMLPMNKNKWKCPTCKQQKPTPKPKDMDGFIIFMETKFKEQRSALQDDIRSEINSLQVSLTNLESKFEGQLSKCTTRVTTLETDISQCKKSFGEIREENDALKKDLLSLKSKTAKLEQQARCCNIEIQNVPESKTENLENMITKLGTTVGVPIELAAVRAVHRVAHNSANTGRPKAIVVQFTTRRLRDNVLAAARVRRELQSDCLMELQGKPPQTIYVTEHLTLENKILFSKARALKKKGYSWVWAKDGNIMARKGDATPILHIRSESDIHKLLNNS